MAKTLSRGMAKLAQDKYVGAPSLSKQILRKDVYRMLQGNLGPNQADIEQAQRAATAGVYQQGGAQQRELARASLAGTGPQQGALQSASQQVGLAGNRAAAEASAGVQDAAMQQKLAEANLVNERLQRQQERYRQNAQSAVQSTLGLVQSVAGAVGGMTGKAATNKAGG